MNTVDIDKFRFLTKSDITAILSSEQSFETWCKVLVELERLNLPGATGGVVRGEIRALFYLLQALNARDVLEIGFRSGHSTVGLALSLSYISKTSSCSLTSIDITDWNDEIIFENKFRHKFTPAKAVAQAGCSKIVQFVIGDSTKTLPRLLRYFDLVFIDGSHKVDIVFQDIINSSALLNYGGMIVLHDYYPDLKPLWSCRSKITAGPFKAVRKIRQKEPRIDAISLNDLPWVNWEPSHKTTLAVLTRLPI